MKLRFVVFASLAVAVASPALAQNRPPLPAATQPAPELEAMSARLMQEINASLSCGAGMVSAGREIERLQARVKELEMKPDEGSKGAK